ncbi:MAG: DUF427 domain-containing protein [Pseudomonadota bacterium]
MNAPLIYTQRTGSEYCLAVEPISGTVTATNGDTFLARSDRALLMRETRLPATVYFPRDDVLIDLTATSDLRTFCPFKGTAHYGHSTSTENAWWSYTDALPEAKEIEGYIGFMPHAITGLEFSEGEPAAPPDPPISGPLVDWLLQQTSRFLTPDQLVEAFGKRLNKDGIAVSRISLLIWSLHPFIAGRNHVWHKGEQGVRTSSPSYDIHTNEAFVNSPLRYVAAGLGGVRQRLTGDTFEFSFPIMHDLKAAGATDYVAMPLTFSNGDIQVMTLACDHPDGFTTANLGLLFEISGVLARQFEVFTQAETARTLLDTYVGPRTGARIMGGNIRRGDSDEIDAAILMCDLRGSTTHEERLDRADYLDLLNRFFQTVTDEVNAKGGEVLKFIGNAVLAIFPVSDDAANACRDAAQAATAICTALAEMDEPLTCAIGIDFGNVTYGNVGSQERLDFTVIGRAAIVAARLADVGKARGETIVASRAIAEQAANTRALGSTALPGLSQPTEAFAID